MPEIASHKICRICNQSKPRTKFYSQTRNKDRLFHECKSCWVKYTNQYSKTDKGKEVQKEGKRKFWASERGKQIRRIATSKMRQKFPEKAKARLRLYSAIKKGKIIKPSNCQNCGINESQKRIEAHHYKGYAPEHWFDVIWICSLCHWKIEHLKQSFHVVEADRPISKENDSFHYSGKESGNPQNQS